MNQAPVIRKIDAVLSGKTVVPALTRYNRLESRPRTDNFTRALRAEVRDALWMLCKQWQMAEFAGDDAGSPVSAKLHVAGQQIARYAPLGQPAQDFDLATPLETTVERRPIPFAAGPALLALDLRLQLGRRWLQLIPASAHAAFRAHYAIAPPDFTQASAAPVCAHAPAVQQCRAVAGRAMDGGALYLHLRAQATHLASDGVAGLSAADKLAADAAGPALVAWFDRLYAQRPQGEGDAWQPARLEYAFACATANADGTAKVLAADAYYHGHLDWYNFDWDQTGGAAAPPVAPRPIAPEYATRTFIPAPLRFDGMPDTRWWAFEDGKTNFGAIRPGPTDLAKMLLVEFGLVYANDWFLLPHTVQAGTVLSIAGLAVTNNFGERFWIEAAGAGGGLETAWQRWSMFGLNVKGRPGAPADRTLLMLPTVPKVQSGPPLEVVALARDELANMVWGIETTIALPAGGTRAGSVAAGELQAYLQRQHDAGPPAPPIVWQADVRYDIMTTVPGHWIPFVPEHVPADNRQVQLRRAAMPRLFANDPAPTFERVRPRTALLRQGLDQGLPYRLHEEEVPRAGTRVTLAFQRTRWTDGSVHTWLGVQKQTGRGGGHSGLAFDRVVPVEQP